MHELCLILKAELGLKDPQKLHLNFWLENALLFLESNDRQKEEKNRLYNFLSQMKYKFQKLFGLFLRTRDILLLIIRKFFSSTYLMLFYTLFLFTKAFELFKFKNQWEGLQRKMFKFLKISRIHLKVKISNYLYRLSFHFISDCLQTFLNVLNLQLERFLTLNNFFSKSEKFYF